MQWLLMESKNVIIEVQPFKLSLSKLGNPESNQNCILHKGFSNYCKLSPFCTIETIGALF